MYKLEYKEEALIGLAKLKKNEPLSFKKTKKLIE